MNKISIIIPTYNAESTIVRTVRWVLQSTIPVDVWVVDDGSTDRTPSLLDAIANNADSSGSQLHILRQANCGAYQARLNALKRIGTPWFGFVDADDLVEPTMFERMVALAEAHQLDVVQCGFEKDGVAYPATRGSLLLENAADVRGEYVDRRLIDIRENSFIWDKIYRNQYDFNRFDATDRVTNFDDLIFNLQFFEKVKRMGFVNEPLYHYSTTSGSAVHSFSVKKLKDFREAVRVRQEILPRYGVDPDGEENRRWFRSNRLNCTKAALRAGNLSPIEKIGLLWRMYFQ